MQPRIIARDFGRSITSNFVKSTIYAQVSDVNQDLTLLSYDKSAAERKLGRV